MNIDAQTAPQSETPAPALTTEVTLPENGIDLEQVEKSFLSQALQRTSGNQMAAARLLGLTRYAVRYRMEKFGIKYTYTTRGTGGQLVVEA